LNIVRVSVAGLMIAAAALTADTLPHSTTFYRDVLPILQKNCQTCHRPGEVAPMSLLSYEATRPWAKAIKAAVLTRKMPPWPADVRDGRFSNDRSLKQNEIDTLVAWVNSGARGGERQPGSRRMAGGLDHPAGRCALDAGAILHSRQRGSGADEFHHPDRLHEGHLGHVNRDSPKQPFRSAPCLARNCAPS
jgi:hypothetical protein